jgi:hypothetical protein
MPTTAVKPPRRNPCILVLALSVVLAPLASRASHSAVPAPSDGTQATMKDIMETMIGPVAETLWSVATTVSTPDGFVEKRPETDEEWEEVEREAASLVEAAELLLVKDRPVAKPGTRSATPGIELEPEQIASLLDRDFETWSRLVHELEDTAQLYIETAEARATEQLLEDGDKLNTACENCHEIYWYPEEISTP